MFDAMIHDKIDTEGLKFETIIEDVESLNQRAIRNELDISKISFAAFLNLTDTYQLLNSGAALGNGVGPLLITKNKMRSEIRDLKIAVPGKNTTANFLLNIFFPEAANQVDMIFSEIEDAVLSGAVDAGVIIHENRFTYEQKGLAKICDLGELWEKETKEPIPLGGIAVKKIIPVEIRLKLDRVMRKSVEFAFANPESSAGYVRQHAQEMNDEVRKKHIALYVNEYSINLGKKGKHAVESMFSKALDSGIISSAKENIFVGSDASLVNP